MTDRHYAHLREQEALAKAAKQAETYRVTPTCREERVSQLIKLARGEGSIWEIIIGKKD